MLTRTSDLMKYSEYMATWYGLSAWTIEKDPIVAALLPGGQYVKPVYHRVIPENNQFGQNKVVNNNGTAMVYAAKNNSTEAYWKSVAGNMTSVLKQGIKRHNETVIQVSSVPMGDTAKKQFATQLNLLKTGSGENAARFTMYANGTSVIDSSDNIDKVLGALTGGEATLSVSAAVPKKNGDIMLSISTKALDAAEISKKTYQVVPNDSESSMALLSIAVRNMDPRTPSYSLFADRLVRMLDKKFNEVESDASKSASIVVFSDGSSDAVPAFKIFRIDGRFYVHNVNGTGVLCDKEGKPVNIRFPNEKDYILNLYKGGGFSSLSDVVDQAYRGGSNR